MSALSVRSGTHKQAAATHIEAVCRDLLRGISTQPTDLASVARRLNVVAIEPRPGLPFEGLLERRRNGDLRVLHSPSKRPGFTIGHELGHAYLIQSGYQPQDEEKFCDLFAAELLMPSVLMKEATQSLRLRRLRWLASGFQVSLASAAVRAATFTDLGALMADQKGLLWRVGEIHRLDPFLATRVTEILDYDHRVHEPVKETPRRGGRRWILEGERIRASHAFMLITPDRSES